MSYFCRKLSFIISIKHVLKSFCHVILFFTTLEKMKQAVFVPLTFRINSSARAARSTLRKDCPLLDGFVFSKYHINYYSIVEQTS